MSWAGWSHCWLSGSLSGLLPNSWLIESNLWRYSFYKGDLYHCQGPKIGTKLGILREQRETVGMVWPEWEEGVSQRGNATQGSAAQVRTGAFISSVMGTHLRVFTVWWHGPFFYLVNPVAGLCKRAVKKSSIETGQILLYTTHRRDWGDMPWQVLDRPEASGLVLGKCCGQTGQGGENYMAPPHQEPPTPTPRHLSAGGVLWENTSLETDLSSSSALLYAVQKACLH